MTKVLGQLTGCAWAYDEANALVYLALMVLGRLQHSKCLRETFQYRMAMPISTDLVYVRT